MLIILRNPNIYFHLKNILFWSNALNFIVSALYPVLNFDVYYPIIYLILKILSLDLPTKYLLCFSFYTNTRRLITPDTSMDTIKIFNGMRVFSIFWVILAHTYSFQNYHAISK